MCHVLIIEDEPFIALILQDILEGEGATSFEFAVTEQEAVTAALARVPALITSDVKLVEGTGPLAVQRIHDLLGEVPVIFITATPQDHPVGKPLSRVLAKPVSRTALAEAFHELAPL